MIPELLIFLLFLFLIATSGYTAAKGLLSEDIAREKKWLDYEKRSRK